jgi:hypothetical protein
MESQVQAAADWAKAMAEQGKSPAEITDGLRAMADQLVATAVEYGAPIGKAREFADIILGIPTDHNTKLTVDTSGALREIVWYTQEQARILRDAGIETTGLSIRQPSPTLGSSPVQPRPRSASGADDVARFLEEVWRQRMEGVKNRFQAGQATLEEYQRSLDELMAREVPWTDRWVALQQEKADAAKFWPDAVKSYLESVYQHRNELEDNQYQMEVISKDRYLAILEDRLKGLEEYSDAWMAVMRKIQEVEGDALEAQMRIMQAYDAGRKFERDWLELADQRALSDFWLNARPLPTGVAAGSTSINNSKSLTLNVPMTTSSPERVTNDTLRAGALAMGFG